MLTCVVPNCGGPGVHAFPKNKKIRKIWEKVIRRENFVATKYSKLCTNHFKDSDYILGKLARGNPQSRRYLKRNTIPTIFPWTKQPSTPASEDLIYPDKMPHQLNSPTAVYTTANPEVNDDQEYIISEKVHGLELVKLPQSTTIHVLKDLRDIGTQTIWKDYGF